MFDDDSESMQSLVDYLKEMSWQVELTASEAILDRLRKERFDLIMVDQMIQPDRKPESQSEANIHYEGVNWKQTGLEFLRRLRRGDYSGQEGTPQDINVIVVSAVPGSLTDEEKKYLGPNTWYVEKPYRLSVLGSLVNRALQDEI
jgi:CheY-like chemotaxis protein